MNITKCSLLTIGLITSLNVAATAKFQSDISYNEQGLAVFTSTPTDLISRNTSRETVKISVRFAQLYNSKNTGVDSINEVMELIEELQDTTKFILEPTKNTSVSSLYDKRNPIDGQHSYSIFIDSDGSKAAFPDEFGNFENNGNYTTYVFDIGLSDDEVSQMLVDYFSSKNNVDIAD